MQNSKFSFVPCFLVSFRFTMNMELIIVMGITWTIEFISEYVDNKIIQLLLDICNLYRGVLIFLIFICKRRILVELIRRIGKFGIFSFFKEDSSTSNYHHFIKFFLLSETFLTTADESRSEISLASLNTKDRANPGNELLSNG